MADIFNLSAVSVKYSLRNTGEEVEVIAFGQEEQGARSESDWVTYIDSEGREHIKEHLNIQLDFKLTDAFSKAFSNILDMPKFETPSTENTRLYEVSKELLVKDDYSVERAIETAKRLVSQIKSLNV